MKETAKTRVRAVKSCISHQRDGSENIAIVMLAVERPANFKGK